MSIYQKKIGTFHDYPAYEIIEIAPAPHNGAINLKAGDNLYCLDYSYQNKFKISSVISSTLEDGRDPLEAVNRAINNGHELHFIFPLGSCITSHKQDKGEFIGVRIGQKINFEGKCFEICSANNNNLSLAEVND